MPPLEAAAAAELFIPCNTPLYSPSRMMVNTVTLITSLSLELFAIQTSTQQNLLLDF